MLVVVLWMIAALSVLVVGLSQTSRLNTQMVQYHRGEVEARAFLEAGLIAGAAQAAWVGATGQRHGGELALGDVEVVFRVLPATGFVDLNAASHELLVALFHLGGEVEESEAVAMASAVVEQRQRVESLPRGDPERYQGPLRVVEDLALVPGVSLDLRDIIFPMVTVYSGSSRINPFASPPEVLSAVAPEAVAWVADRLHALPDPMQAPPGLDGPLDAGSFFSLESGEAFRVDASVKWRSRVWRISRWYRFSTSADDLMGVVRLRTEALTSG